MTRRILVRGMVLPTNEPADFILARKQGCVWKVFCRNTIFTFDPNHPRPFNVERYTKEQIKDRMEFIKQWGTRDMRLYRPYAFEDFIQLVPEHLVFDIDSVDQAREADDREVLWRKRERLEHMKSLFGKQRGRR